MRKRGQFEVAVGEAGEGVDFAEGGLGLMEEVGGGGDVVALGEKAKSVGGESFSAAVFAGDGEHEGGAKGGFGLGGWGLEVD